jgi:starch synthase
MRVLFAASELYPLIKTGGLGDVAHSLPNALRALDVDIRVAIPAYREVLAQLETLRVLGWLPLPRGREVRILQASHAATDCPVWLIDLPGLFDRGGLPYTDDSGRDWPDNPQRFTLFSECVAALAQDPFGTGWVADIVHANDWQTGLVPAYLSLTTARPASVFTVHNIAYDCQFDHATFTALGLPPAWWSVDYGEFYGRLSMLKCGLVFSDRITTVSPRYAEEIRSPAFGYGYASILEAHAGKLTGILNGIDDRTWDPATDPHLVANYDRNGKIKSGKRANRAALLRAMGATDAAIGHQGPLFGSVGRLVDQKGIDLLLDVVPSMVASCDAQFALIGSGEARLEQQLLDLAEAFPERVFCFIGYSESLAHQLEAGSDVFVMPSRYEPCGLNQMYSLRYGTPPVVRETGGLADTVVDTTPRSLARGEATGFVFGEATVAALRAAMQAACDLYRRPKQWTRLIKTGMQTDFGWRQSADTYLRLYQEIL